MISILVRRGVISKAQKKITNHKLFDPSGREMELKTTVLDANKRTAKV